MLRAVAKVTVQLDETIMKGWTIEAITMNRWNNKGYCLPSWVNDLNDTQDLTFNQSENVYNATDVLQTTPIDFTAATASTASKTSTCQNTTTRRQVSHRLPSASSSASPTARRRDRPIHSSSSSMTTRTLRQARPTTLCAIIGTNIPLQEYRAHAQREAHGKKMEQGKPSYHCYVTSV